MHHSYHVLKNNHITSTVICSQTQTVRFLLCHGVMLPKKLSKLVHATRS